MQQQTQRCPIHQQKKIIGYCVSKSCKKNRLCCLKCLNEFHSDHTKEIVEQEEIQQLMKNNNKALESVFYQITELESVLTVIKLSYQTLMQNTPIDLDNPQLLIDQIETILKVDNSWLKVCFHEYQITMKQIGKYAECIFNFKIDEYEIKENIEKLNQVKELVKQDGCSKSIQVFENILATQTQTQTSKIQSIISTIFQPQQQHQEKQQVQQVQQLQQAKQVQQVDLVNLHFMPNYLLKNISVTHNFKRVESISFGIGVALIQPSLGKSGCLKIKFKFSQLIDWIGLGVCKKEIVEKNSFQFGNSTNIGHGYYLISWNSVAWNHIDQQKNNKQILNFQFANNDIITLIADSDRSTLTWCHETKKQQYSIKFKMEDNLFFCAVLRFKGDSVEILG